MAWRAHCVRRSSASVVCGQYAAFDTNCDGAIDCDELHDALQALGVRTARDETIAIFEAIVKVAPPPSRL